MLGHCHRGKGNSAVLAEYARNNDFIIIGVIIGIIGVGFIVILLNPKFEGSATKDYVKTILAYSGNSAFRGESLIIAIRFSAGDKFSIHFDLL
jgi:hypothetical protein